MLYCLNKPQGLTPLEALKNFSANLQSLAAKRFTYAGRLDPMADGLLLALDTQFIWYKPALLALPKTYTATCIFNLTTDTGDILGLPQLTAPSTLTQNQIEQVLQNLPSQQHLPIPNYASVPVDGKPLWLWQQQKQQVTAPHRMMTIHKIELLNVYQLSPAELLTQITKRINRVSGNFRQAQIISAWNTLLNHNRQKFTSASISITCSSGSYIRSIIPHIGQLLGTQATLLSLTRHSIGPFSLKAAWQLPVSPQK